MPQIVETTAPLPIYAQPEAIRYAQIDLKCILHSQMLDALDAVQDAQELSRTAREPICVVITGQAGAGKSSILQVHKRKHPADDNGKSLCCPVVSAKVPPGPTPKGLASRGREPRRMLDLAIPEHAGDGNRPSRRTRSCVWPRLIDRIFPFEKANEALAYVKTGRAKGKVVIAVRPESRDRSPD